VRLLQHDLQGAVKLTSTQQAEDSRDTFGWCDQGRFYNTLVSQQGLGQEYVRRKLFQGQGIHSKSSRGEQAQAMYQSGFSREIEPVEYIILYTENEIYHREFAHVIMEAKESHKLPTISYRPGKLVV
jgi:hypothetical protein